MCFKNVKTNRIVTLSPPQQNDNISLSLKSLQLSTSFVGSCKHSYLEQIRNTQVKQNSNYHNLPLFCQVNVLSNFINIFFSMYQLSASIYTHTLRSSKYVCTHLYTHKYQFVQEICTEFLITNHYLKQYTYQTAGITIYQNKYCRFSNPKGKPMHLLLFP